MSINLTLLIQILHFLIAYWFMRRFLFAPIVAQLHHEDVDRQRLQNQLLLQEQNVRAAEETNRTEWHESQKKLITNKPMLASQSQFVPSVPPLEHIEISHDKRGELIGQLSKHIVHKVSQP